MRESYCMNNLGRRLVERECSAFQSVTTEPCNDVRCPDWSVGEWTEVGFCLLSAPLLLGRLDKPGLNKEERKMCNLLLLFIGIIYWYS